jgi:hypothetical protein
MAAPVKYKAEYGKQATALCKLGATDHDLAEFFGVTDRTLRNWKIAFSGFSAALKVGKEVADDRVERSLYNRAVGYSFPAQKIMQYEGDPVIVDYVEHVPPDVVACIFWMKNRRPDMWRDKHDVDVSVTEKLADNLKAARERAAKD